MTQAIIDRAVEAMSLKFESSIVSANGGKGSNIEFGCAGNALFLGFLLLLVNDNGIMK